MGSLSSSKFTSQLNSDSDDVSRFAELCRTVCAFGESAGVRIVASHSQKFEIFSSLNHSQRQLVLASLESYVAVCQGCLEMGNSLKDSKALLWSTLKHFGMKPSSDLFTFVTDDQVIEIYNMDHIQIFRNFKFFEFVSYTLEDLFCRPRYELFLRPDERITELMGAALATTIQAPNKVHELDIPEHEVHELDSVFKCRFDTKIKYGAALTDANHSIAAYIVLEEVNLTFVPPPEEQEQLLLSRYTANSVQIEKDSAGAEVIQFVPRMS